MTENASNTWRTVPAVAGGVRFLHGPTAYNFGTPQVRQQLLGDLWVQTAPSIVATPVDTREFQKCQCLRPTHFTFVVAESLLC